MKLHMIGGPYAGCIYEIRDSPKSLWGAVARGVSIMPPDGGLVPVIYKLQTFYSPGEENLVVLIHEGSTCRDAMLDMLATHRQVSEQQGPARSLIGRMPSNIS